MSYQGRTSGGRYTYRPNFDGLVKHYENGELQAAKARLTAVLGKDGFYTWACTLLDAILFDDKAYLQAINRKLVEVEHISSCDQNSTNREAQ